MAQTAIDHLTLGVQFIVRRVRIDADCSSPFEVTKKMRQIRAAEIKTANET